MCEGKFVYTQRKSGDEWGVANALGALACVVRDEEEHNWLENFLRRASLLLASSITGTCCWEVSPCSRKQQAAWATPSAQVCLLDEALALIPEGESQDARVWVLVGVGNAALKLGRYEMASAFFRRGLANARRWSENSFVPFCLQAMEGLAAVVARGSDRDHEPRQHALRALCLLGAANTIRREMGLPIPPSRITNYDRAIAAVHQTLGEADFAEAWATGQAMTLKQAIAYARYFLGAEG